MTLISILMGLALEYFLGPLDRFRNFHWFDSYVSWVDSKCRRFPLWDGPPGVLVTLALPVLALLLFAYLLGEIFIGLWFVLSILVFLYSLGPNLNTLLNNYTQALEGNMEEDVAVIESGLNLNTGDTQYDETAAISTLLWRSHEYIFAIIFWFAALGMAGAFLYCLTRILREKYAGQDGGYAVAVAELHKILVWPPSRLQAMGFAMAGSLVDTLEAWRKVEGDTFDSSAEIIVNSGLGALQYEEVHEDSYGDAKANYVQWIRETQALINRSLIIWLTVLGLLTLGGAL